MSRGTPSSQWLPDNILHYTNDDEKDTSNFEASYDLDTGYTNPVDTLYFNGFNQSEGAISSVQFTQLPPENLFQHGMENDPWSNHSNTYSSGPTPSLNCRYQNL